MTKIILPNILWCILFSTLLNFSNGLMDYHNTLRKFPYVMSPTPFISRQTRDVQEILNTMVKGDDGSQIAEETQKPSIENQIEDQHSQHSIRSEQLLPSQSNYQYSAPQMYGPPTNIPQQSQNIIRQALESEATLPHHIHSEQNQQNSQQQEQQQIQNALRWSQPDLSLQNQIQQQIHQHVQQQIQEQQIQQQQIQQQQIQQQQIQQQQIQQQQFQQQQLQQQQLQRQQSQLPLYTVPPQIHNQLQSIYQNQPPIPSQSISYSYNQNYMSSPYPPKMEIVQPSLTYLPSSLQPPSITATPPSAPPTPTPLAPTTQTTPTPSSPPPPMINITPRPRISNTYIPVMPPTSPKPTKAVITNIYSYDSPADSDEDANAEEPDVPTRQHYKILFIRAPNQISKNTIRRAHAQHQNQQKTVVYILSKKTDVSEIRDALQYLPTTTTKPEVHFIRYKTEDEAEHAKHQIQHHYHQLSDSTQYSNEGVPLITSAIGIVPRNEADVPNNSYLPPIQHNNESGYLPPPLPASQTAELTPDAEYLPPSK